MNTFSIIRDALALTENDPQKEGLDEDVVEAGRIVAAVQIVVDALTPPDGGRYIVGFKNINTAGTSLADRTITVSSRPLRDPSLSLIEKAVVVATFAAHEIGHTFVTRPRKYPVNLITDHNDHSGYHSVANIADDIVLEPFMVERYPILADAFAFTGLWVLRNTSPSLPITDTLNAASDTVDRFNQMMHATRYGDIAEIIWTPGKMVAERDWYRDWAGRLLALDIKDQPGFLAACDELWERIREIDPEPPEEEPEPPIIDEPEPTDEGGEDEPEPGDEDEPPGPVCGPTGEGEPEPTEEQPKGNDFDEPEDDDEDGDPQPGGEDDGESEDEGDDEDGDGEDGDEGDEPTPGGDQPTGESTDSDDDEPDKGDFDGHDGEEGEDDTDGGGGNAEADRDSVRDEDDFDESKVEKTTHDEAEQTNLDGDLIDRQVRTYASTTATVFGRHGHMTTTWD